MTTWRCLENRFEVNSPFVDFRDGNFLGVAVVVRRDEDKLVLRWTLSYAITTFHESMLCNFKTLLSMPKYLGFASAALVYLCSSACECLNWSWSVEFIWLLNCSEVCTDFDLLTAPEPWNNLRLLYKVLWFSFAKSSRSECYSSVYVAQFNESVALGLRPLVQLESVASSVWWFSAFDFDTAEIAIAPFSVLHLRLHTRCCPKGYQFRLTICSWTGV